jgi:hypothetical protein
LVFADDLTVLRARIEQENTRAPAVSLAIDEAAQARLQRYANEEHQRVMAHYYEGLRAAHAQPQHILSPASESQHPAQRRGIHL